MAALAEGAAQEAGPGLPRGRTGARAARGARVGEGSEGQGRAARARGRGWLGPRGGAVSTRRRPSPVGPAGSGRPRCHRPPQERTAVMGLWRTLISLRSSRHKSPRPRLFPSASGAPLWSRRLPGRPWLLSPRFSAFFVSAEPPCVFFNLLKVRGVFTHQE